MTTTASGSTSSEDLALNLNLVQRVNLGDALTRSAARTPAAEAVVDGDRRFTYREFDESVNRVAHGLLSRGYRRGDALAILSGNSVEFLQTYFACAKIGVVAVPLSLVWRAHEITYVLNHSGARGIVVEAQLLDKLKEVMPHTPGVGDVFIARGELTAPAAAKVADQYLPFESLAEAGTCEAVEVFVGERDPLSYMYTSGTTAAPKGVVSSHLSLYIGSLTAAVEMQITRHDRLAAMMPLFHIAQLNAFATPTLLMGGAVVLKRGFDAPGLLELIEREKLTVVFGLPLMYREMLDHPDIDVRDLTSLRRCGYAMAPIPKADLLRGMEKFGCEFSLGFGQTEMVPTTTIFHPEQQLSHHGSVGTQVVNVQIEIMARDGTLLPRGESGEIVYRGPQALNEYLHDDAATAASVEHGWFHSGDIGHFTADGVLWFEDRSKDVIKTGGENVASLEVERAVLEHVPAVREVAVIGLPHPKWVEAVTAAVIARPGESVSQDDVLAALGPHLPAYKRPKAVIICEDFPRTATGKIQKHLLRQQHADHFDSKKEQR
jgi:acyl-CoA synthetase (AMP-forming)/AMP-acid ligase II